MDSQKGDQERQLKHLMKTDKGKQSQAVLNKISQIDKALKIKLNNNYKSVRVAFLALDSDHDGFITVEDFLRTFGNTDFSYNDLRKLIESKNKDKQERISYEDFSSWLGNCIHMSEGFYFRHDSIKNPGYDRNLRKINKNLESKEIVYKDISSRNLIKSVIEKISTQWKTIRKAFSDINKDPRETGYISQSELKFYLDHWGFKLTQEQFESVYNSFDFDGDGKISYTDFTKVIGSEIHPGETLYFRQDKMEVVQQRTCFEFQCWQASIGNGNYCFLHNKMHSEEVENLVKNWCVKAGKKKWKEFSKKVRQHSNPEDQHKLIELTKFEKLVKVYLNRTITPKEKDLFVNTSGRMINGTWSINVSLIYSTKFLMEIENLYSKLDIEEDEEDDAVDAAGYLGEFHRAIDQDAVDLTEEELIALFINDNKMDELAFTIRSIDRDHNGYVTWNEMEDILKILYPEELKGKNLK